jgi:DNA gyrase/topoisomerase IV subunit A
VLPTGGTVEGGIPALLAGRRARLVLGCTIAAEPGQLVITEIPMGVTIDALTEHLSSQVRSQSSRRYADYLPDAVDDLVEPVLPVSGVSDESCAPTGIRVVCTLRPGAEVGQAERWVRSVWPATIEVDCRLPAPMRRRLLGWDREDGSGLAALRPLVQDS